MDSDDLEDDFLNFSPITVDDVFPESLPASEVGNSVREQDGASETTDDEIRLDDTIVDQHQDYDANEGSFGDDEQVVVASDQYSWKIDHARGDHKFKGRLKHICGHASAS
jgi:hypothetical protein